MARLWSCGFELATHADQGEWYDSFNNTFSTIATNITHGGKYSYRATATGVSGRDRIHMDFSALDTNGPYFVRTYIYIAVAPSAANNILYFMKADNSTLQAALQLNTDQTITLRDGSGTIGSNSPVLSLNAWHSIELGYFNNTTTVNAELRGRVDGVQFASTTTSGSISGIQKLFIGPANPIATYDLYFDDIALNDGTGSFQNSWPGEGIIVQVRPSGSGDSTQWSPLSGTNYGSVNEITPDDATSYVQDSTSGHSDLYPVSQSGLPPGAKVLVVQVGGRFRNDVADATTAFKLQIERAPGSTITQSSAIIPNTTSWLTNRTSGGTTIMDYLLTLYQDPTGANWTQSTIDSMQIGVALSAVGTNKIQLSTIWAIVEYLPDIPPALIGVTTPSTAIRIIDQMIGY